MNLSDHIKLVEGKVEAAYQTILAVAEDREFKGIQMRCIWKLVDTCIIPIITYSCETWEPNKQEIKKLNQILDKILRRILMTPDSTPRQALYIETGMLDIETIIDKKRLNMMGRLKNDRSRMMDIVLNNPQCKWKKRTDDIMEKYGIFEWELAEEKWYTKQLIINKTRELFHNKMEIRPEGRTKIVHFLEGKGEWKAEEAAEYMNKMTRKQASIIFKTRTRMIKVKGNYKNGHQDQVCRACGNAEETQKHALIECPAIHPNGTMSRRIVDPFSDNINVLKETAQNISSIIEELNSNR